MSESTKTSFWTTIPGILTAIAGIISAIAVLVTAVVSLMNALPKPSPAGGLVETAAPTRSASAAASAFGTSSGSSATTSGRFAVLPPSGPDGRILFYSLRIDPTVGAQADLYGVDPASGAESRINNDSKPDSYPVASPDGKRIAFDSRRVGNQRDIWLVEPDGSLKQLTNDAREDSLATWSPDGSQIAWVAGNPGAREIWVMSSADGTGARRLTSGADDVAPSWSKTGLIAFQRRVGSGWEIWVVDPYGVPQPQRLVSAGQGGGSQPSWSHDGTRLAFVRGVNGVSRIFAIDADGRSNLQAITPGAGCDCAAPSWSLDGSEIAYNGAGAKARPIMIIPVSGGNPRRVDSNGLSPSWGR